MVNNIKHFASILIPGFQHMRHTQLPEHKFDSGQTETGSELLSNISRELHICL